MGRPAVNPAFGYHGRRSFGYGAPIDPRAAFAGALIGGFIGALAMPLHYEVPYVTPPQAQWTPPLDYSLQANSVSGAPSIADRWQQFGEPGAVERAPSRSPIVDHWQKFFEPSQ